MNPLLKIRQKLSVIISTSWLPDKFSIIADDCWAGQLYEQLHIEYLTPTVGLWIKPENYLKYLECFDEVHKGELEFIVGDKNYPVAMLSGVEIHFMHFDNEQEAREKYLRRLGRIDKKHTHIKIDFGKPGYTRADMDKWNELRIPNSVAFYPPSVKIPEAGIYNGILIPDWVIDGAVMFDRTRRYFNLFEWLRSGRIENGLLYRIMNLVLFDPTAPKRIVKELLQVT
jgi:uncharacterized protein (DUF1919 family)